MKTIGFLAFRRNAIFSVTVFSLAACGGGSGSDEEPQSDAPAASPGFVLFSGAIADSNGTPISGAQIRLPYGNGAAWGSDTDASGNFSFQARVSDFVGVSPVAVTIEKEGYRPRSVAYRSITEGTAYALPSNATTALSALQSGEYVPKINYPIVHIGNDQFGGAVNSQLQLRSIGDGVITEPFVTWNSELSSKYSKIRLEFIARGIDPVGLDNCQNQIGFSVNNDSLLLSQRPAGSAESGDYTSYTLEYSLGNVNEGSSIRFFARSGPCVSGDIDDFEFTSVFVKLLP